MKTIYRILSPLCCIALIPIFYFVPLIRVFLSSALSENLMSSIGIKEYISINYIVTAVRNLESSSSLIKTLLSTLKDKESTIGQMFTNKGYLIAALVFFIISIVLILVTAGFSLFSKKYFLSTGLTVGAMVTLFITNKLFDAFAAPMISGEIGIGSLISSSTNDASGMLGSIMGNIVSLDVLRLSFAYSLAMFILGVVLILGICAIAEVKTAKK